MYKIAVLWLATEDNELLLAQRAHHKERDPGTWGPTVTGTLEPGETVHEALIRETEEEIGLKSDEYTPQFLFEKDFMHPDGTVRRFYTHGAKVPKTIIGKLKLDYDEVSRVEWLPLDEVLAKIRSNPEELVPSAQAVWPETFLILEQKL